MWAVERAAHASLTPDAALSALRDLEVRMIYALIATGEDGVIGRQAKDKLKRMPSTA